MSDEQPKRSIDERLDAIAMNLHLASQMAKATDGRMEATDERINKLTATVEKHEADWQRARRAMRAALAEWFSDNGDDGEQP